MELRLTQRDLDCFKEFLDLGCLTAKQLVNLSLFPNEKKSRDRLRRLNQARYVEYCPKPYLGPGRAEYVYYLNDKKISDILSLLGCSRKDVYITKPSAYSPFLLHHLAVTDFVICVRQACKQSGIYAAEIVPEYKQIAGRATKLKKSLAQSFTINGVEVEIIPDGVICLSRQKAKTLLFFEIYRGTQTLEGKEHTIQNKLVAYATYWRLGLYKKYSDLFSYAFKGFRVLVIVHTVSTLEKLKRICCEIEPIGLFWFATAQDITQQTIFKAIWHVPGKEGLKAIINQRTVN